MHLRNTHRFSIVIGFVFILILGASVIYAAPTAYTLDFSAYPMGTSIPTLSIDGFTFSTTGFMNVWNSGASIGGGTSSMKLAVDADSFSFTVLVANGWCLPGNYWYVQILKSGVEVNRTPNDGCYIGPTKDVSFSGVTFDEVRFVTVGNMNLAATTAFKFNFVDTFPPVPPPVVNPPVEHSDVDADADDDGVLYYQDNCANAYNPSQEDGWGSAMGDACDTEWYNASGRGLAGYEQKDGMFNLFGNCVLMADGALQCPVVASFDPTQFSPENMPALVTAATANGWTVWIYYLHSNNGPDVYQANVYDGAGNLVDDRLELHVSGGSYEWFMRGGDPQYHGN